MDQTPRSGILWSGSTTVRARPWRHSPTRAFLLIAGSHGPDLRLPDASIVGSWLGQLADWGYQSVRTSALSPGPAAVFAEVGFASAQELALMSASLDADNSAGAHPITDVHAVRRVPGRPHSRRVTENILRVDRAAFGDQWCMDEDMFDESRTATRRSRLLVAGAPERPEGFLAVGATDAHAFLQRLAVHPSARRRGVATRLVAAAHRWAVRSGCTQAIVNTEMSNTAALGLYRSFGYHPMDHGLSVMERGL